MGYVAMQSLLLAFLQLNAVVQAIEREIKPCVLMLLVERCVKYGVSFVE